MALPAELTATVIANDAPLAWLLEFAFVSETKRIWLGFGTLVTLDARQWSGVGEVLSIDGLSPSFNTSAPPGRITASGVSAEIMARAIAATEYRDRPRTVYLQAFQGRALYGNPVAISSRVMKTMEIARDAGTRVITINDEGPYTGRRRPPAAWFSDRDQQKRHPGDKYCERVPYYRFRRSQWPHYT
jgi:hypothetical protein